MTDQPTRTGHQLDPTAVAGLQVRAERTCSDADRYAAVLEDIATNGPPGDVEAAVAHPVRDVGEGHVVGEAVR